MRFFRIYFVWELFFLFSFALGMDQLFFEGDRFWGIQLHPFFFIVILVSIQYGTNKGLIASLLATVILLAGNIPKQSLSQDHFEFLFYISHRPMLWFALAILLGGFRDKYFRNLESTQKKLIIMEKQAIEFCGAYKLLDKERNRLEVNLTSQPSSIHLFNKIATKAKTLDHREIFNSLIEITDSLIRPEKCSWYYLKDSKLKMVAQKGWKETDKYLNTFSSSSKLYREIIERKRFLCVTKPEDELPLTGQGVLAGPLYNKDTGKIYGMVKIEDLGFLGLNLTNMETFKVLCEWLGTLLETSMRFQQSQNRVFPIPQDHLMPLEYFKHIAEFLLQLSNRVSFECHTIELGLSEKISIKPDFQNRVERVLREIFIRTVRRTDLIFERSKNRLEYIILLPNTSLAEAQNVSQKLKGILLNELGNQEKKEPFIIFINSLEKNKFIQEG